MGEKEKGGRIRGSGEQEVGVVVFNIVITSGCTIP